MKLDKDFKDEADKSFKESDYVGRKILVRGIVLVGLLVALGTLGSTMLKEYRVNREREIFKQSTTYNEGVLDDLAKYRHEMIKSKDDVERKAIADLVNSKFANYDESKIENTDLKDFLKDCRNLTLNKYKPEE